MVALSMVAVFLVMMLPGVADAQKNNDNKKTDASKETTAANNDNEVSTAKRKKKPAEFARGKGVVNGTSFSFNVVCKDKNPATQKASGTFRVKKGSQFTEGKVSCLRAETGGNIANFVGRVTKSNVVTVGSFASFDATDASSGDLLDFAVGIGRTTCHDPIGGTFPSASGNIVIRPLPGLVM